MVRTTKRTVHSTRSAGSNKTTRQKRTPKHPENNKLPTLDGSEETRKPLDSPSNYIIPERKSSRDKLAEITKEKIIYQQQEENTVKKNSFQETAEPLLEMTRAALKKDGETNSEDDKFLAVLEGGIKYAPKIAEILSAVAQNIKTRNTQNSYSRQNNLPQAPPGWNEIGPLEKMKRKYDPTGNITAWYAAGIAYEQSLDTTGYNATPSYPPTPQAPPSRVKEWTPTIEQGPPSMPPVYEGVPSGGNSHVSEEQLKQQLQNKEDPKIAQRALMVQAALKKIEEASEEKILEAINNQEQTINTIKEYTVFMEQDFLLVLKNTPVEEYLQALEQYCPSKKTLLGVDENKEKITSLLEKAKNIL